MGVGGLLSHKADGEKRLRSFTSADTAAHESQLLHPEKNPQNSLVSFVTTKGIYFSQGMINKMTKGLVGCHANISNLCQADYSCHKLVK